MACCIAPNCPPCSLRSANLCVLPPVCDRRRAAVPWYVSIPTPQQAGLRTSHNEPAETEQLELKIEQRCMLDSHIAGQSLNTLLE